MDILSRTALTPQAGKMRRKGTCESKPLQKEFTMHIDTRTECEFVRNLLEEALEKSKDAAYFASFASIGETDEELKESAVAANGAYKSLCAVADKVDAVLAEIAEYHA